MNAHPTADSYWVVPGLLLAGEYPGARLGGEALTKLGDLLDAGVRAFIDLTEAGEYGLRPYWPLVQQLAAERGVSVTHQRISIRDMCAPAPAHMLAVLNAIDAAVAQGCPVYVHCYGGIGRTGTVAGCYLVRHGTSGAAALAEIARLRQETPDGYRQSPETEEQRQFVLAWR